jgi:NAD(P) transhydrogenase subunit alpha
MDEDYKRKQAEKIAETLKKTDIAIATALIPGKPAPVLITEEMVKGMRKGSVIVDLAVEAGGNCPLSEYGKVVVKHGVTLVGHANVPARLAADTSLLFAKNLLNFLSLSYDKESKGLSINWDDEIIKGTALTRDGQVIHPALAS